MKTKILAGLLALAVGFSAVSCDDEDDYSPATGKLVEGVTTGSSDVTATTATLNGTVTGNITTQASGAYTVGFYYGTTESLGSTVTGSADGNNFSATIDGLTNNTTIYYKAFLTLQGTVTYEGTVKTLITTNAKVTTGDASNINANDVTLAGTVTEGTSDATSGVVIAASSDVEKVRAGLILASGEAGSFTMTQKGLLPGATYYYAAYLNLGTGVIYGDVKSFTTQSYDLDVDEDFVDLGLSTKWCKFNLGTTSESELGGLFAFADVTGVNNSTDVNDYPLSFDSKGNAIDIYKTEYDVANKALTKATLPTADEFQELFDKCTKEWTTQDGVSGYKFTGPSGNSIFLPAAGSRKGNTISSEGEAGLYLTGSVNSTNNDFAISYEFANGSYDQSTEPRFMALSVRPVTVAKNIAFDKSLLYKTWEFDLTLDGEYQIWKGPVYFYGTLDSWATVTNKEPLVGDSWSWEAGVADSLAYGNSAACVQGSITFFEKNDSVSVTHVDAEGKETTEGGYFTIDEEKKTISLQGVTVLCPTNFPAQCSNLSTDIKILSISKKTLQLGVLRDDPATLSLNYISQLEKYGYKAKLTCYGDLTAADNTEAWSSATETVSAADPTGTYTITFNASIPRLNGQVYVLDIPEFATAYPNAFVRIDKIEADGKDVPFDANKFYYGNIEGAGTYRVELANIYGYGHNNNWNGLADSPFRKGGGETTNETALAFEKTFAVTFTIVSTNADLKFDVKQTAVGYNSETVWDYCRGNWNNTSEDAISVTYENFQYKLANTQNLALSLSAAECNVNVEGETPDNGAVNLIDVVGIRSYFSGFSADLISVVNDDSNVDFKADKILYGDLEGNGNFRVELHNVWGSTASDPAFGDPVTTVAGTAATSLGFTKSTVYTIGNFSTSLFAVPTFE